MSDDSEQGETPVGDATAVSPGGAEDPTVAEVVDELRREHPEQVPAPSTKPVPLPVDAPVDGDNGGA